MAGTGGTAYQIRLSGYLSQAHELVAAQPWVSEIVANPNGDETVWMVSVSDPDMAEQELARLILQDRGVRMREFRPRKFELEEVFMNIVGGSEHGG